MSRIGKKPIALPQKVKVETKGRTLTVEGPSGKLNAVMPEGVTITVTDGVAQVHPPKLNRANRGAHGLVRALLANMVKGVTQGYERTLEINGVGYKAEQKGTKLVLTLGYSHPCEIELPAGVTAKIDKQTVITIKGADKQVVGQMAAQLRAFKKPEPYQGKGVKYAEEVIRRKVGKTGAK